MRTIALLIASVAAMGAQEKARPSVVPKNAVEISPGVYRHTDAKGKAWLYHKSPFGYSRTEENPSAADKSKTAMAMGRSMPSEAQAGSGKQKTPFGVVKHGETPLAEQSTKVTEAGETLHFERASPFGSYKWSRKKSELTSAERAIWQRQQSAAKASESGTEK